MINYYVRQGVVYVKIDHTTKEIINVLNLPTQKTISRINGEDYYNNIMNQVSSWSETDEVTFNSVKSDVLNNLSVN